MIFKKNPSLLSVLLLACLFLTYYVNVYKNLDIVYTHLFYIPIVICGLWFHRKAVYLALLLGLVHISADYYATHAFSVRPLLRAGVFVFVGYLVGIISEKRDRLGDQLEKINSAMLDFVCEIKLDGSFGYVSSSVKNTLGYKADELTGKPFLDLVHPDDKKHVQDVFDNTMKKGTELRVDYRYRDAEGNYKWVESLANKLESGGMSGSYVFGNRDISPRKQMEEELKFLSLHDGLTGLYNRRFFQEQMQLLDGGRADPIAIISCDIDGLKIINDHFGHQYGDQTIAAVAKILQQAVRVDDIVARIGGDEFVVLMPRCSACGAEQIRKKIREALKAVSLTINGRDLPVMLSVGGAVRDGRTVSANELFVEADNKMYAEKKSKVKKLSVSND